MSRKMPMLLREFMLVLPTLHIPTTSLRTSASRFARCYKGHVHGWHGLWTTAVCSISPMVVRFYLLVGIVS
jgi:hypothetical protein